MLVSFLVSKNGSEPNHMLEMYMAKFNDFLLGMKSASLKLESETKHKHGSDRTYWS